MIKMTLGICFSWSRFCGLFGDVLHV